MHDGSSTGVSVAETFLKALKARGIDHVLANSGTDFAPIIEALVRLGERAEDAPKFLTIPHENLAVAMGHGYHLACGKAAAVMVHVTVGTGNTVCALMNAYRDEVPLLLMAGRTPITQQGHIASRSHPIHWGQENFDQAGMVREYTKWDFELRAGQRVEEVVGRALDVALAKPRGPVYLTLPREVLANAEGEAAPALAQTPVVADAQPSQSHVETIAEWLAAAERPVIVTSHVGRDTAAVAALGDVANALAIPVVEAAPTCVNLPASHPMLVGAAGAEWLERADVILVVEAEVPWFPRTFSPAPHVRVAHLGVDPLFCRYPIRSFPADLVVPGQPRTALRMLADRLNELDADVEAIDGRRSAVARQRAERAAARRAAFDAGGSGRPIRYEYLAECLRRAMPEDALLVTELGVSAEALELERPGSLIGVGIGGGLGFGLGAALGAKLAAPGRTVIATVGDGSYMFGNPTPYHLVSRALGLPVLTIVCNNGRWQAVDSATRIVYPEGRAAAAEPMPLVELAPTPEFSKVAEASDAFARRVDEPADLPGALADALAAVQGGRQALLDVRLEHGLR